MENRKKVLITILIIIGLLAVPTTLAITTGELFPEEEKPYRIGVLVDFDTTDAYAIEFLKGVSVVRQTGDVYLSALSDIDTAPMALEQLCSKNMCNMVLAAGDSFNSYLNEAALRYPEIQFVTIDGGYTDEELRDNIADFQFKIEEASYPAGYIAGMMTETNVIGFIGGTDTPPIDRFYYGFKAGIDAAAREKGERIQVVKETIGSYHDKELGYAAAEKMYTEDNCDIILAAAGSSGIGAVTAATILEKYVICVDTDLNYFSPKYVLCSVIKDIRDVSIDVMTKYAKGEVSGGHIVPLGISDLSVDVVGFIAAVPDSLIEDAELLKDKISAGKITVPYDRETYEAYSAPR